MADKMLRFHFTEDELSDRDIHKVAKKAEKAADKADAAKYTQPEPEVQPPAGTQKPEDGDGADEPDVEKPAANSNLALVLILVLALLGGGFFACTKFFKNGRKKEQNKPGPDADYSDEDEEDYGLPEDTDPDDDDGGRPRCGRR